MDQEVLAAVGEAAGEVAMKEGVFAIAVTGLDISPGSAQRERVTREEVDLSATVATGWVTLPESVQRERETMEDTAEEGEREITMVVEVDPSVTSAIGLVTLPASAARKKIVATSVMELDILQEIAAKMRTRVTIAMRLDTS